MTAMMNKIDLVILPVLNVDGYAYTWTKVRFALHLKYFHNCTAPGDSFCFQNNPNSVDLLTRPNQLCDLIESKEELNIAANQGNNIL